MSRNPAISGTRESIRGAPGAEHISSVSLNYQVDFHAELWSPDLKSMAADISCDLSTSGSSISYTGDQEVRHTANLRWGRDHSYDPDNPDKPDWGRNRLKLLCRLTNMKDDISYTYPLGFYFVESVSKVLDTADDPITTSCYDLTAQLDTTIGETYYVPDGTSIFSAIRELLSNQGQWGRYQASGVDTPTTMSYFISPSEANIEKGRVWQIDDNTTWRRVLNRLADEGGYRIPWVDREGTLIIDGQYGTATTVTLPTGGFTVLGEGSRYTTGIHKAPNQWIGIGVVAEERGKTGLIVSAQDINIADGLHSFEARGKRVVRRVYHLDIGDEEGELSADNTAFQRQMLRLVNADREETEKVDLKLAPMPVFWHSDVVEFDDLDIDGKWRVSNWSLPLDGSDMSVGAIRVAEDR